MQIRNKKMKFPKPSPKILIFGGGIALFFVAFFGYGPVSGFIKNTDFKGSLSYNKGGSVANINSSIDSDHDNLMDWQEALWKTDPKNPDTDADGTSDGDEVAAGRDPNKPGPDDKITRSLQLTASAIDSSGYVDDPNNASQQLSQDLFSQFMAIQANGGTIDDTAQAQIINNTLSNLQPEAIPPRFALSDVKVFSPQDKAQTKDFGNNFMQIHQDAYVKITPLTSNEESISIYTDLLSQLATLSVPSDMGTTYLTLLNNYYALTQLSKTELNDVNDPVKTLMAIKSNQELDAKNLDIYTQFADYFKNNAIIWNNNEPGYAWNNF